MTTFTFFVEAPPEWVSPDQRTGYIRKLLFQRYGKGTVLSYLAKNGFSLAICTGILDAEYAELVREINLAKVPLTHWIVLQDDQGYWTNGASVAETRAKIEDLLIWNKEYGLSMLRIGLDIEWPLQISVAFSSGKIVKGMRLLKKYKKEIPATTQTDFDDMLMWLRMANVPVEFYAAPPMLERFFYTGLSIPRNARVVEMIYSSFFPKVLATWCINLFYSEERIPALGIVNGISDQTPGRMLSPKLPRHLTAEELRKDIETVGKQIEIYIFALNGAEVIRLVKEVITK